MESEYRKQPYQEYKKPSGGFRPFVYQMENGYKFRINRVVFQHKQEVLDQLRNGTAELKYCVRDDEETNGKEDSEQWELVLFPQYYDGREIPHSTVVDHSDSAVNGNIIVQKGIVVYCASNHVLACYDEVQNPVADYVDQYIQHLLEKVR